MKDIMTQGQAQSMIEEVLEVERQPAPLEEGVPKAMSFAIGMFNKQQADADKEVGREMSNLSKRYISILQGITGVKDGWVASPTPHLLSIDNEDAGITIDIHWEVDLGSGNADVTVELNKRKGAEGPGAKWKSKFHVVKNIKPNSSNLSPAKIMTDSGVRRFLKENVSMLLAPLMEEDGWEELTEAVEPIEVPRTRPTYPGRKIIHPQDVKEYGGGQSIKAVRSGNNSEMISRVRPDGGYRFGIKFMSTQAMAKTLADAGYDVWLLGRDGGRDVYIALRLPNVKVNKKARRAMWSAYGEPWDLESYAQKHGIELTQDSYFREGIRMEGQASSEHVDVLRAIMERKGTPYGKQGASKEADTWNWEKKYVGSKRRSGANKQYKKAAKKGERQAAKKEIDARLRGEDESNPIDDLRGILEGGKGKGSAYEKTTAHGTEASYEKGDRKYLKKGPTKEEPWKQASKSRKHVKKTHAKSVRRSKKKEIQARLRGEELSRDDLLDIIDIMAEEIDELQEVFFLEMKENEEIEAELDRIAEAMAIGSGGAYEVPSPVPFAKKATLAGRRHWRKQLRKHGIPMGAQEMMMELAQVAQSLPSADRKLVDKVMNMTWYGPEDLGNVELNAYVDAIKKLHKKIFGKVRGTPQRESIISEAKQRSWTHSGDITFKVAETLGSKDIGAISRYMKIWANGGERAGPSMLPGNKRWKCDGVRGVGRDKFEVRFLTDAKWSGKVLDDIESEIIGSDGFGGMLWDFAVKSTSSPDDLQFKLYGGYYQADDHMIPIKYVSAGVD